MKKLSLDLDQIAVESFATEPARRAHGTVRGHDLSDTTCNQIICDCYTGGTCDTDCGQITCDDTCANTCGCSAPQICVSGHTCDLPSCAYTCGDTCGCVTYFCV